MEKIIIITGRGFLLTGNTPGIPADDVDTDRIIPARFLRCVTFDGLGNNVFEDDRKHAKGQHSFDLERNQGCNILVVGKNFGSGSSRQHAVEALVRWGIKVIIGESFAEIFQNNALTNGLACVTISQTELMVLSECIAENPWQFTVNLDNMTIKATAGSSEFNTSCKMPTADREKLITGTWDDLGTCYDAGPLIEEAESRLPALTLTRV
jgi:3-isopropylmalate/(R)-2-methylmalate dehydratase small subunit